MRVTDSEQSTDEICIDARVAAVFAGDPKIWFVANPHRHRTASSRSKPAEQPDKGHRTEAHGGKRRTRTSSRYVCDVPPGRNTG